jgi:hypothetical protein
MLLKRLVILSVLGLLILQYPTIGAAANRTATTKNSSRRGARILLIPLDDRPPCLQFPQMIGLIGNTEVVTPPRDMLGRFVEPGRPEEITDWVKRQDLSSFDAVIVSIDMLAYGGLVNSRVYQTPLEQAKQRLQLVDWLHHKAPRLPIYGFNTIMRLAPTGDGVNERYRDALARWAEIAPEAATDVKLSEEKQRLEQKIPIAALEDYRRARERNFAINRESVELVRRGVLDFLILCQDDAKPRGVHIADRERLISDAKGLGLDSRIAVQPGADEVAMLLLSRALNRLFRYQPRVAAVYSSDAVRRSVAPFEDRPLNQTVSFQIAATGSREVREPASADILFYVYGSRAEEGAAAEFAKKIESAVKQGRRVIVADIDFKGDVQGADPAFTRELLRRRIFPRLAGYASWNTAGNTIGTALPHGLVYSLAVDRLNSPSLQLRAAQQKFLLHRLIDDYAYHSLVRPGAVEFAREKKLNPNRLEGDGESLVETSIRDRMRPHVEDIRKEFAPGKAAIMRSGGGRTVVVPVDFDHFTFSLPWGRTFEAEINFNLKGLSTQK